MSELQNLYVRIPLLQDIKEIPIYAKEIKGSCLKKLGRNPKDPPSIQVGGIVSSLMMGKSPSTKYNDPGNQTIIVQIGDFFIPNTLVD